MGVPVILHMIFGVVGHYMIKGNREIKGSLFLALFVIDVFHEGSFRRREYPAA
jgi:hypothetical protein